MISSTHIHSKCGLPLLVLRMVQPHRFDFPAQIISKRDLRARRTCTAVTSRRRPRSRLRAGRRTRSWEAVPGGRPTRRAPATPVSAPPRRGPAAAAETTIDLSLTVFRYVGLAGLEPGLRVRSGVERASESPGGARSGTGTGTAPGAAASRIVGDAANVRPGRCHVLRGFKYV